MAIGRTARRETAPRAQHCVTACSGSDSTTAMTNYSMSTAPGMPQSCCPGAGPLSSVAKTTIVWSLGRLLDWHPSLAMQLGMVVTRIWPGMREV
jgi:hypothetical protein